MEDQLEEPDEEEQVVEASNDITEDVSNVRDQAPFDESSSLLVGAGMALSGGSAALRKSASTGSTRKSAEELKAEIRKKSVQYREEGCGSFV